MTRPPRAALACAPLAALLVLAGPATAQPADPVPGLGDRLSAAEHNAANILSQPVHDVGLFGRKIPAPLRRAGENPYGLSDGESCADIDREIAELNGSLGPEPAAFSARKENRLGALTKAGGRSVVNSLIPFRSMVREVSGAAPAQRRLQAAIDAGFARRGFLRGVFQARRCGQSTTAQLAPTAFLDAPD